MGIGSPMAMVELEIEDSYRLHRRFDRMGRLVGDTSMKSLFNTHVMIVGCGGVGSFAAEALIRSGIGELTLVDFDLICITNTNRQLHTMRGTIGKPKVEIMAERLQSINPQAIVRPIRTFYDHNSSDELLNLSPAWVIDAIDNITAKCHLLSTCSRRRIPVITSTGAGARMDTTRVRVEDLAFTKVDPLAKAIRKILREKHGFSSEKGKPFNIPAVYSEEPCILPQDLSYDKGEGFRCVCPQGKDSPHGCEKRNRIDGTAPFVTGAFGLAAASWVIRSLVKKD